MQDPQQMLWHFLNSLKWSWKPIQVSTVSWNFNHTFRSVSKKLVECIGSLQTLCCTCRAIVSSCCGTCQALAHRQVPTEARCESAVRNIISRSGQKLITLSAQTLRSTVSLSRDGRLLSFRNNTLHEQPPSCPFPQSCDLNRLSWLWLTSISRWPFLGMGTL